MVELTLRFGVGERRGFATEPSQHWSGLEIKACISMRMPVRNHCLPPSFDDSSALDIPVGESSLRPNALLGKYPQWASQ